MEYENGIFEDISQSQYRGNHHLPYDPISILRDFADLDFFTKELSGVELFYEKHSKYYVNKKNPKLQTFAIIAAKHVIETRKKLECLANGPPICARYRGKDLDNKDILKLKINPDVITLADNLYLEMVEGKNGWYQEHVNLHKGLEDDDREAYQIALKPMEYTHAIGNVVDQVEQHMKKFDEKYTIPEVHPDDIPPVKKIIIVHDEEIYKFTDKELPELFEFIKGDPELTALYKEIFPNY